MTELLPKPKPLEKLDKPQRVSSEAFVFICRQQDWIDYYKRLAEFAIEALERIEAVCDDDAAKRATNALSTIKGSRDEN